MAIITIPGSNLGWSTISEWVALCNARGQIVCACSGHYAQMDALYRSLTIERVRASHDNTGLAAARELLDNARNRRSGLFRGPERSLARAEIGALLVECTIGSRLWYPVDGCCHASKAQRSTPPRCPTPRSIG
jgi:hypothetical protein